MTTTELFKQIRSTAQSLSKDEREQFVRELFAMSEELSEGDGDDDHISDEFAGELERRLASARDGTAELIPADVVFAQLRARYPER